MIYDARTTTPFHIAKVIRAIAAEHGAAHVYVKGWMVTVRIAYVATDSYAGVYDHRATEEHVMQDVGAAVYAIKRH